MLHGGHPVDLARDGPRALARLRRQRLAARERLRGGRIAEVRACAASADWRAYSSALEALRSGIASASAGATGLKEKSRAACHRGLLVWTPAGAASVAATATPAAGMSAAIVTTMPTPSEPRIAPPRIGTPPVARQPINGAKFAAPPTATDNV